MKRKTLRKSVSKKRIRNRINKGTQRSRHLFFNRKLESSPLGYHFAE